MNIWTDVKLYKLVQLYSKFNNLWDRKHPCYDNLADRHTSYKKILASLSMPEPISVSDVIDKLKELRASYVCELQKIQTASKTGTTYTPNHTWFNLINEFLYDHLDADEKLTEIPSSEDVKEFPKLDDKKKCDTEYYSDFYSCSDINSHQSLIESGGKKLINKNNHRYLKSAKKSQAYFIRSPTVLRSTKMNTRYELPRKKHDASSSIPLRRESNKKENLLVNEETQQQTRVDVKMTASEVSIKYCRTETVNGEEISYKKNLEGFRNSTRIYPYFKNIKMIISKSGYTNSETGNFENEDEEKDTEFWDIMSMLNLSVPNPLTKLETSYSPNNSCTSIITSVNSNLDLNYLNEERKASVNERLSCIEEKKIKGNSKEEGEHISKKDGTQPKITNAVCLGDGTIFDENIMELLEDLSVKICPVEIGCGTGCCSSKDGGHFFGSSHSCKTCSTATRPVKKYSLYDPEFKKVEEPLEINEDDEMKRLKISKDFEKSGEDNPNSEIDELQKNYDEKMLLKSGDKKSTSERKAILHEAKKELREAGKLYNNGKYITRGIIDSGTKYGEILEFDNFGTEVASSLKTMGKQRATRLKRFIAGTLELD